MITPINPHPKSVDTEEVGPCWDVLHLQVLVCYPWLWDLTHISIYFSVDNNFCIVFLLLASLSHLFQPTAGAVPVQVAECM